MKQKVLNSKEKYVYHRKIPSFQGLQILSLNQLKNLYPKAYKIALKKYRGREEIINKPIPNSKLKWNDLIHTSPIHPRLVNEGLLRTGRNPNQLLQGVWFKIPLSTLKDKTIIYYKYKYMSPENPELTPQDFEIFSFEEYQELTEIPKSTLTYYKQEHKQGKFPLLYHLIPHILIEGPIDITNLEVITL